MVFSKDKKLFEDFGIVEGDVMVIYYSEEKIVTANSTKKDILNLQKLTSISPGKLQHLIDALQTKTFVDKPKEYKRYSALQLDQPPSTPRDQWDATADLMKGMNAMDQSDLHMIGDGMSGVGNWGQGFGVLNTGATAYETDIERAIRESLAQNDLDNQTRTVIGMCDDDGNVADNESATTDKFVHVTSGVKKETNTKKENKAEKMQIRREKFAEKFAEKRL